MLAVLAVLNFVLYLALLFLILRLILDWIQTLARSWRPRGLMMVVASTVYTVTDPPMNLVRRWIPPLRVGNVSLDLGFLVLLVVLSILQSVIGGFMQTMIVG